jgi:hypothetical protein|tara:strand:- start:9228 stop:9941 length:714 start_codon:yes stop_codon:yes gene_type:complete
MADTDKLPSKVSSHSEVDKFLQKVAATPVVKSAGQPGRLIFAMDATASRQHAWDTACHIQAEMFANTSALGGLEIQLCYYRGFGEFSASPWYKDSSDLLSRMTGVFCLGGRTQIARLLQHTIRETGKRKVQALVFVGDAMEEDIDALCDLAGKLGLLSVPIFLFQEGSHAATENAFKQLARLSKGAYCHFDATSAGQLQELLSAVAVFAAGGHKALQDFSKQAGREVLLITQQLSER